MSSIDVVLKTMIPLKNEATPKPKDSQKRSSHWPDIRLVHLRQFPRCAACGSGLCLNVHHVRPFHLFPALELDPANLITLCEGDVVNCHLLFGHLRSWHSWNPDVVQDAAEMLNKIKGRPK